MNSEPEVKPSWDRLCTHVDRSYSPHPPYPMTGLWQESRPPPLSHLGGMVAYLN